MSGGGNIWVTTQVARGGRIVDNARAGPLKLVHAIVHAEFRREYTNVSGIKSLASCGTFALCGWVPAMGQRFILWRYDNDFEANQGAARARKIV